MSECSKSMQLLDLVIEERYYNAKTLCNETSTEINMLEFRFGSSFTKSQKEAISEVRKIIQNLNGNQNRAAKAAASSTSAKFAQHIEGVYFKTGSMKPQGNFQQGDSFKGGQEKWQHENREQNQGSNSQIARESIHLYEVNNQKPYDKTGNNVDTRVKGGRHLVNTTDEFHKNQASKRASQSLRINNSDIADLSDTNRPTKIAEKFSELYDNEWTEAFESLSRATKGSEKEIIAELLRIVEKYKDASGDTGTGLLVQYRKGIAKHALQRLQDQFTRNVKNKHYANVKVVVYANKAVELTWWMVVQDPPIYMCPTSFTFFDNNLYRSYTRSGQRPEYFVWPALKLHEEGGVLIKGVVQYRD